MLISCWVRNCFKLFDFVDFKDLFIFFFKCFLSLFVVFIVNVEINKELIGIFFKSLFKICLIIIKVFLELVEVDIRILLLKV